MTHNPLLHAHSKHVEIDVHFVREEVIQGLLEAKHVPFLLQTIDLLTKPLGKDLFFLFQHKLGIHSITQLISRGLLRYIAHHMRNSRNSNSHSAWTICSHTNHVPTWKRSTHQLNPASTWQVTNLWKQICQFVSLLPKAYNRIISHNLVTCKLTKQR